MKAAILILFLFPILYGFAQEEKRKPSSTAKPSTTDCPTWNKKGKPSSKAAYFQYLRSPKTKVNQQGTINDFSKIQPNSVLQKNENSNQKINVKHTTEETTTEKVVVVKPEKIEKNNTANSSANEKNTENTSVKSSMQAGEKPLTSIASSEEKNVDIETSGAGNENNTKSEIKDNKKENKKLKRKLNRLTRKTTKVGRHSNAKCPSF